MASIWIPSSLLFPFFIPGEISGGVEFFRPQVHWKLTRREQEVCICAFALSGFSVMAIPFQFATCCVITVRGTGLLALANGDIDMVVEVHVGGSSTTCEAALDVLLEFGVTSGLSVVSVLLVFSVDGVGFRCFPCDRILVWVAGSEPAVMLLFLSFW